ncbi:MAG: alpha/beta fold hydrolase [Patescibacteria group bacterium]|nr:alpha/beta fold hydrolase [Patescibacteria group bacterium]
MQKLFIKNRQEQKISVIVEEATPARGLAFVMHGLGGFKEQPHLQVIADAFLRHGYTVVRFDTTNTLGESDGTYEQATTTNYLQDLEDVIVWASQQPWYHEPFCLVGHSLGGICTALYAQRHPRKVKALAPISTVVSRELSVAASGEEAMALWKKHGWKVEESRSKPGVMKRLPWSFVEDGMQYDLLPKAKALTMPVLLAVGELDETTPAPHQKILFDALPGKKELHVIRGAPHTFHDPKHLDAIKKIFDRWIVKWS